MITKGFGKKTHAYFGMALHAVLILVGRRRAYINEPHRKFYYYDPVDIYKERLDLHDLSSSQMQILSCDGNFYGVHYARTDYISD